MTNCALSNTMNESLLLFLATPRIPIRICITSRMHKLVPRERGLVPNERVREWESEREREREKERESSSVDDVDPLLLVTTRRRNSSDEANSRVLFPPDSVPHADSGEPSALRARLDAVLARQPGPLSRNVRHARRDLEMLMIPRSHRSASLPSGCCMRFAHRQPGRYCARIESKNI